MVDARGHASLNNWGEGQEQAPTLRDWGLGGVIRWRPAGGGMGPEMSLSPAYGGTLGAAAPSLNAEIGYRMSAFGGVLTPYSAAEFGNGHQSYRAGAHFEIGPGDRAELPRGHTGSRRSELGISSSRWRCDCGSEPQPFENPVIPGLSKVVRDC